MSEIWVFKDTIELSPSGYYAVDFESYGIQCNAIGVSESIFQDMLMYYTDAAALEAYNVSKKWTNNACKTIKLSQPASGDLLTWLQANAVRQASGNAGLKNLSSYNQDLSVPRKKDMDSKQDKIIVDGIVQSDGAGNFSAADVEEAEMLEFVQIPAVSETDNDKFLRVVDGAWAAVTVSDANGVSF